MPAICHRRGSVAWDTLRELIRRPREEEAELIAAAPRFSPSGWAVARIPEGLHGAMLSRYFESRYVYNAMVREDTGGIVRRPGGDGSLVGGGSAFGDQFLRQIHESPAIVGLAEAFSGERLEPTFWYGPRLYLDDAVLELHVDRPATHLVSLSVCIACDLRRRWPICVEVEDGFVEVDLEPGEALLYEGVRLAHFRPYPLEGEYVGAFFHYRPCGFQPSARYGAAIAAAEAAMSRSSP